MSDKGGVMKSVITFSCAMLLAVAVTACSRGSGDGAAPTPPTTVTPPPPPPPPAQQSTGSIKMDGLNHEEIFVAAGSFTADVRSDGTFYFEKVQSDSPVLFEVMRKADRKPVYDGYPAPAGQDLVLDESTMAVHLVMSAIPEFARLRPDLLGELAYASFNNDPDLQPLRDAVASSVQRRGYLDYADILTEYDDFMSRVADTGR